MQNPLQFNLGGCYSSQHEVKTIQIALQKVTSMSQLKFSIYNKQHLALLKIFLSYYLCHLTCKSCNGDNYNQCTKCFQGAGLVDGICLCPIRTTQSGDPPSNYRFLNFCLLGYSDKELELVKPPQLLWLQLQAYSYAKLIQWNIIYDPENLSNNKNKCFGTFEKLKL
ncbi:unnamed protein product (macronuclear) [Paramecium tetraurelia]|uniref:Uncharacterized protein n=1 Tax=Paramecium tetraurelia TaxID=5888 RepID=A0BFB9_PARTE|nr:uncharacterized protein GSPATT00028271001 [Paramecium tetraurelia]CAK57236.1 unnamed protein product [Paramecium tetraurelia]|eukprot:XP_001424634.1 hypothetical protein (macronuclear) [Paramecium tetraurelia strain d4-2]